MPELKPCPFCNGEANIVAFFDVPNERFIRCGRCGACTGIRQSEGDAVAAWNRRALEQSKAGGPTCDDCIHLSGWRSDHKETVRLCHQCGAGEGGAYRNFKSTMVERNA